MRRKFNILVMFFRISLGMTLVMGLIATYYFAFADRWSKPIIKNEMNYNLKTASFMEKNVFIVSPKNEQSSDKIILFFHGGGYVEEMTPDYWKFFEKIVNDTKATIIIPDYPLAPKYNYIDVFNMIEPLYKDLIKKIDTKNLILMGDSAGGGMALALLEKLNLDGVEVPNKTVLISPWLDVELENDKIEELEKLDDVLNKKILQLAGIVYAENEENIKNYLVSPIYGDLTKISNVTIFIGTYDILNPDVHLLIEKAREQGNEIKLNEYEMAKHIWIIKNNSDEEITKRAYTDLLEEIR